MISICFENGWGFGKAVSSSAVVVPSDFAGLKAHYDSSDASTLFADAGSTPVASDADLVYQWNDLSAAGLLVAVLSHGLLDTFMVWYTQPLNTPLDLVP